MSATRDDISEWFDAGVEAGATHMIIVCDTFDYSNFPKYVLPHQNVRELADKERFKTLQNVDEVYDLRMSKAAQFAERRAFHY